MARELKVYGMVIMCQPDESAALKMGAFQRQVRAVVAVTTKKAAAEKFGISMNEANSFMAETGNSSEIALAMGKPGQVFAFAPHSRDYDNYLEIARKAHTPFRRGKRLSYDEQKALRDAAATAREARTFTKEELEYLADMFTDANNPVAASIAAKAKLQVEN
jgi:hypothetical protein